MGLLDIIQQYASGATPAGNAQDHFNQVAQQADPQDVGRGVASAFRSDATPPFSQMVGSLFGNSNPQQQAGVLNELIRSVAPGALGSVGGGVLGRLFGGGGATPGVAPTVTPAQASQLSPDDVSAIAAHAENHDGSVVDRLGSFYAQHPALVQSLGAAALGVVMSNMHRST